MSALSSKSLWFARSDQLKMKDPCEGARTLSDAEAFTALRATVVPADRGVWMQSMAAIRRRDEEARLSTFISCWQMNEYDMISMWERYCNPPQYGVAIQTTYARLDAGVRMELDDYETVMMGLIKYGLERTDLGNPYSLFMNKKVNYSDEREVRMLFMSNGPSTQIGFAIGVDFNTIVEQVIVSPFASGEFPSAVASQCKREGFAFPVSISTARNVPDPYVF